MDPSEAAYEAAALVELGDAGEELGGDLLAAVVTRVARRNWKLRAIVRAVWSVAYAAGRSAAATDIRGVADRHAEDIDWYPSRRFVEMKIGGMRLAAGIAEGSQPSDEKSDEGESPASMRQYEGCCRAAVDSDGHAHDHAEWFIEVSRLTAELAERDKIIDRVHAAEKVFLSRAVDAEHERDRLTAELAEARAERDAYEQNGTGLFRFAAKLQSELAEQRRLHSATREAVLRIADELDWKTATVRDRAVAIWAANDLRAILASTPPVVPEQPASDMRLVSVTQGGETLWRDEPEEPLTVTSEVQP